MRSVSLQGQGKPIGQRVGNRHTAILETNYQMLLKRLAVARRRVIHHALSCWRDELRPYGFSYPDLTRIEIDALFVDRLPR